MAEVWLATDMSLSRQVAVKVLKSTLAADPVVAERFRREAITVARLSHPNIVAVHDTIDFEGRQAVVMQLINGKSLRQLLDEQKRLGPELTMHIGSCVASALDAAHAAGLVHRDVKPGNILITPDGRVLLADFGIAKGLGTADDLTSENVMMGTAKYLSPEQVRGKKLDGRADLYALGLVLYECLAGKVPFLGETDADTALARLQRDPTDLARLRLTLPYGLAVLIHELLARNPDDRPSTGGDLRNRLTRIASGVDDRTTTMTPPTGTTVAATAVATAASSPASSPAAAPSTSRAAQPLIRADSSTSQTRTGGTPRQGPARPINAPPPPPGRDRTPTTGSPRGVPARQFQQRRTPTIMVIVLLVTAVIVGAVLLSAGDADKTNGSPSGTVALPPPQNSAADVAPTGPASIAQVVSYDPGDPQGGVEKPDDVFRIIDGNPASAWMTSCYNNKFFNGKPGVGVVVELSAPGTGTFSVAINSAPYQIDFFASAADAAPGEGGWGSAIQDKAFANTAGTVSVTLAQPAKFVLFLLREAGPDDGCSGDFPFRGAIGEITFTSAN
jgi:eukaryotic-like serine/threonine-protein kinase